MKDAFDQLVKQFRIWEKYERLNFEPTTSIDWARFQIDLPVQMLRMLDAEADQRGVPRQSLVKVILWEWLNSTHK